MAISKVWGKQGRPQAPSSREVYTAQLWQAQTWCASNEPPGKKMPVRRSSPPLQLQEEILTTWSPLAETEILGSFTNLNSLDCRLNLISRLLTITNWVFHYSLAFQTKFKVLKRIYCDITDPHHRRFIELSRLDLQPAPYHVAFTASRKCMAQSYNTNF